MKFDEYKAQINELGEKLKLANDKLATAESDEDKTSAANEISELNSQMSALKDKFIDEQNAAYIDLNKKYDKTEQERLQALKIASDNANKKAPEETDPRKIIKAGFGG